MTRHAPATGRIRLRQLSSLGAAVGVTGVLFLAVASFGRQSAEPARPSMPREVKTVTLPAPDSKQLTASPKAARSMPQPQNDPKSLTIQIQALPTGAPQLELAIGELMAVEAFPLTVDPVDEAAVFEIAELDRTPRLISNPMKVVPYHLLRDGVRGQVRLKVLIDPAGRVSVLDVIHADDDQLIRPARKFAEACRFESPMRNQIPVATAYVFPITF